MAMQNDDLLPPRFGQLVQSFAEVNFFCDKQLLAESTQVPKRSRLTKNERTRHPALPSAQTTPNADQPNHPANRLIKFNRRAAANTSATLNLHHHFGEQLRAWKGIRVHKNKPLSIRCRRARVARPRDLIDGFENEAGALCPGEFASSIRRVIVANNDLMFPANLRKCGRRTSNALQRALNELLFVKSWDNN